MGRASPRKGARVEREIVKLHQRIGVKAERVPLSGAARYQGNGEDVDVYIRGANQAPAVCQVKAINPLSARDGTKTVVKALGDADVLFIRYDAEPGGAAPPPLVVLPWRTWELLLRGAR